MLRTAKNFSFFFTCIKITTNCHLYYFRAETELTVCTLIRSKFLVHARNCNLISQFLLVSRLKPILMNSHLSDSRAVFEVEYI